MDMAIGVGVSGVSGVCEEADECGVLQFMWNSAKGVMPGYGSGEAPACASQDELVLAGLPPDFRSLLSNFCPFPDGTDFELPIEALAEVAPGSLFRTLFGVPTSSRHFRSVEHAFHYVKLQVVGVGHAAERFAVESKDHVSVSYGADVKKAGGPRGVLRMDDDQRRTWDLYRNQVLRVLTLAKFSAKYPMFHNMLAATGSMRIKHFMRGPVLQEWDWLYPLRRVAQMFYGVMP